MCRLLLIIAIFIFSPSATGETYVSAPQEQQKINYDTGSAPQPLRFSEEKIATYRNHSDFDYSEKTAQESWWTMFKRYLALQWQKFFNWIFGNTEATGFLLFLMKMIPYLLLITFLVFLVWVFGRLNPARSFLSTARPGRVIFNEEEKIVRSQNIRQLIDEAVKKEDYRLAIRYHYLFLLQHLNSNGIITYEFSKTDEDYLLELQEEKLKQPFKKLTRIYDFIWYGNFGVGKEDYLKISNEFRKTEQLTISKNEQSL